MSTLYFPQLSIGSLAQYPVVRRWRKATAANEMQDGSTITMAATMRPRVSWDLRFQGLTSAEWESIKSLFTAAKGRYGAFTFLDPMDNLLSWSEDFTAPPWDTDPLLAVSERIADPFGGSNASRLTNGGQTAQRLTQSLAAPPWFHYCFSIYLRSDAPCTAALIQSATAAEVATNIPVATSWRRALISSALDAHDDAIRFGLEIPVGTSLFAFGAQLEPQPAAGSYKKKLDRTGVYPNSRFDQDLLLQTTDNSGQHSTTLQIIASY